MGTRQAVVFGNESKIKDGYVRLLLPPPRLLFPEAGR